MVRRAMDDLSLAPTSREVLSDSDGIHFVVAVKKNSNPDFGERGVGKSLGLHGLPGFGAVLGYWVSTVLCLLYIDFLGKTSASRFVCLGTSTAMPIRQSAYRIQHCC